MADICSKCLCASCQYCKTDDCHDKETCYECMGKYIAVTYCPEYKERGSDGRE